MDALNFYSHEKITDRVYIFTEGYSCIHRFTIGVIVGNDKVLVIDTGLGMGGDLRKQIERVVGTDKPLICASTHCHVDHVGSSIQFDESYVNLDDMKRFYDFAFGTQQALDDLNAFAMESRETVEYCARTYIKERVADFKDLRDGDRFDLGGVHVEVYALPGHSLGSVVFYVREENILFTGDNINTDVSIKKMTCDELRGFANHVREIISIVGEDVTIYSGHLHMPMGVEVLKGVAKAADEVAAGNTQSDPPGETIFSNRANNPDIRMHIADNCILIYSRKFTKTPLGTTHRNFLGYEKRSERLYIVTESYSQVHRLTIGVIVGDDRILVIDSGLGMTGDLRSFIESFAGAGKEIICMCTSGQAEHIGSACQFDRVYMNPADQELLPLSCNTEYRLALLDAYGLHNHEIQEYGYQHCIRGNDFCYEPVLDGMEIDLGGVRVWPIAIPGVTAGQIAYYIPEVKACFTGDAVNMDVHLETLDRKGLMSYRDRLLTVKEKLPADCCVYSTHTNRPHPMRIFDTVAAACEDVLEGKTAGDPPQESMFVFQYGNRNIRLHYHGSTCIVYDRSTLGGMI